MSEITITELRDELSTLQHDLRTTVIEKLRQFEVKTGMTPSQICLPMLRVNNLGAREPRYILGEVQVEVQI